jgi:hypothetical protein
MKLKRRRGQEDVGRTVEMDARVNRRNMNDTGRLRCVWQCWKCVDKSLGLNESRVLGHD